MSDSTETIDPHFSTLAIIGVGLLGGSVAMAAKARGLVRRVVGVGRSSAKLRAAQDAGVIDSFATELSEVSEADLIVVCTPVDRLAEDVLAAAAVSPKHAIITDVGSVKGAIVQRVAETAAARKYVPAHPLAGSEQTGWQAGSAQLFQDRLCVLTPFEGMDAQRLARVEAFWQAVGMRTRQVPPEEHDRMLALTSHLPHVVAAALAALVGEAERPFAATGFRDTTRIAAGDPAVWTPILLANAEPILHTLERIEVELADLRTALERQQGKAIEQWLTRAKRQRDALNQ